MTAPRQILPRATYLITRRCAQRTFLLRPSTLTNDVFFYILAVAAARFGVQVHTYAVLSNHCHLVVTDPDAQLPRFQQFLGAMVARALNASLGRWESFWAPGSYSAVTLASTEDIVEKAAYVLANPVAAGLVRTGRMWPGLWSDPDRFGTSIEIERPRHFFAEDGLLPIKATLELTPPPGFASVDDFRAGVVAALERREREAQERVGRKYLGVARVLRQNPLGRPASFEPRRNLKPRVAARDASNRIKALSALTDFLRTYREAWAARKAGKRDAVFPAGTYLLRIHHGVPCVGFG